MSTERARSHRIRYAGRVLAALLRSPREGLERIRERIAEHRAPRGGPFLYKAEPDWEARLHALLGVDWPCPARLEFDQLWQDVMDLLGRQNLAVGRGAYGGWDDADPAFARAVWS